MTVYLQGFLIVLSLLQIIRAATANVATGLTQQSATSQYNPNSPSQYADRNRRKSITYVSSASQDTHTFRTQPQLKAKVKPSVKLYSSYVPAASGLPSFQYSAPQPAQTVLLPSLPLLLPKELQPNSARLIMLEEPTGIYLTPSQNRTLEAARVLANSLLEASGETPLALRNSQPILNPNELFHKSNPLDRTDVVIVKAQKHAYIVPAQFAAAASSSERKIEGGHRLQQLYQMRQQFEKAYTINQFIFIIKPEKINFLNKLV